MTTASTMVTARMTPEKKSAGCAVLRGLGTSASAAINDLFDYVIDHGCLPEALTPVTAKRTTPSPSDIERALSLAEEVRAPLRNAAFCAPTSLKEARAARLSERYDLAGQGSSDIEGYR